MATIQDEVNDLVRKIRGTFDNAKRVSQGEFSKAAIPMVKAIQAKAPVYSGGQHHRYSNGKIVATYYPGNLRRAIKVLKFNRSKYAVFVGAKLDKTGSGGDFKGNRVDGYYLHMVEYGTDKQSAQPFFRPGAEQTKDAVLRDATIRLRNRIVEHARSYAQLR